LQDFANHRVGDVVRIAPDEVAIFPYEAHQGKLSTYLGKPKPRVSLTNSRCSDMLLSGQKGTPAFIKTDIHPTFTPGERGVFAEIDVDRHHKTKQALSRAFSTLAHKEQDIALHNIVDDFIRKVEAHHCDLDGMDISMVRKRWIH
jgi:hypothetical protein